MAKPGRKTKYTPERIEKILNLLKVGNTRRTAAAVAGVDQTTFLRWITRYADFADLVKEAEEAAVALHVGNIAQAGAKGQWQASAWILERRHYQEWGRKDRLEVVQSVRDLARSSSVDEEQAVKQAEAILKELRSHQRA
jgi:hypothetical protein